MTTSLVRARRRGRSARVAALAAVCLLVAGDAAFAAPAKCVDAIAKAADDEPLAAIGWDGGICPDLVGDGSC